MILASKFSLKQTLLVPAILIVFVCFLIVIVTFSSLQMVNEGTDLYKTPIWGVLLFVLLLIWTVYYYLKTFKYYKFLDRGFEVSNVFGKKFHSWKTIRAVSVIENSYEKILWQYLEEDALLIQFRNGDIIKIFSKYYENMSEIRQFFSREELKHYEVVNLYKEDNEKNIKPFESEFFKGSFLFSFNGLIISFMVFVCSFMLFVGGSTVNLIGFVFLIGLPLFLIVVLGFQAYYFQLHGTKLIVRNHILFHIRKEIELQNVKLIYFEQKFKKEPSIRIFFKDYSFVSFEGSSLKDEHWKSFMIKLVEQNVVIINNLFYA